MKHSNQLPALRSVGEWNVTLGAMPFGSYEFRRKTISETAWCILTKETADIIGGFLSRFNKVVEVFSGTGYISEHLRRASGLSRKQYRSYDACLSHWKKAERRNYGFTKSGCFNINLKDAECVVMSWPNYASNIGYRIARKMVKGQYLIYQGEGYGGCTGDDQFHVYLQSNFRHLNGLEERLFDKHAQHSGMNDHWYILVKE